MHVRSDKLAPSNNSDESCWVSLPILHWKIWFVPKYHNKRHASCHIEIHSWKIRIFVLLNNHKYDRDGEFCVLHMNNPKGFSPWIFIELRYKKGRHISGLCIRLPETSILCLLTFFFCENLAVTHSFHFIFTFWIGCNFPLHLVLLRLSYSPPHPTKAQPPWIFSKTFD